jgi:5,6,7,8-tetrahydromethanopterin hydro-lyase
VVRQNGAEDRVLIGESHVGTGAEAAHVNTVLGSRSGVVGAAWTAALATPSAGHVPFITVLAPGIPVKPLTLFVAAGSSGQPSLDEVLAAAAPSNPFYTSPPARRA